MLSVLHPNTIVCYLHMGVLMCCSYILGKKLEVLSYVVMHYNFSHSK